MESVQEQIANSDWRQGSCIDFCHFYEAHPELFNRHIAPPVSGDLLIVTPYDCSVVTAALRTIPVTRLLVGRHVEEADWKSVKAFQGGKSPYQIALEHPLNNGALLCNVSEEVSVDREILLGCPLLCSVSSGCLQELTRWLANYYRRPALPNAFERRFSTFKESVARKFRSSAELTDVVERSYLKVSPEKEDLSLDLDYSAELIFVIKDDAFDASMELIKDFINRIIPEGITFESVRDSIDVVISKEGEGSILLNITCEPLSEITLGQISEGYFETTWLDYLSFRHDLAIQEL